MKKITIALFCLVTTIVTSQNLIVNPDFQLTGTGGSITSWTHTPYTMLTIPPSVTATGPHGTTAIDDGTGDFYALSKGENGCMYQKVAVLPSHNYSCTLVFRFITTRQTSGYGYAIETTTPLTPPNVTTIINGSSSLKPFCTTNGVWTEFGSLDNANLVADPNNYTRTFTFATPADATFVYIGVGTKGAVSNLQLNTVNLTDTGALSINEVEKPQLTVYPNPANNDVTISNIQGDFSFKIVDVSGKIAKSNNKQASNTINISDLNSGVYFMEITNSDNRKSTTKLIKL